MFFTQDRQNIRTYYLETWQKHQAGIKLEGLEKQVAQVIIEHPEYHSLLVASNKENIQKDFIPEDGNINPFLHMGMHLALREQVGTNRPNGIATITRSLLLKYQDGHSIEHMMIDCLGEMLWNSQKNNTLPDDNAYLECLKHL